jgi:hypothetical protein
MTQTFIRLTETWTFKKYVGAPDHEVRGEREVIINPASIVLVRPHRFTAFPDLPLSRVVLHGEDEAYFVVGRPEQVLAAAGFDIIHRNAETLEFYDEKLKAARAASPAER